MYSIILIFVYLQLQTAVHVSGTAIQGVFSKPYWQIYGELFLSEIRYNPTADEYSCSNKAAEIAAGYRRCPEVNWIVPILSALYMLLSGVVLLNLLVAVFTSTLNSMKPKEIIYKFQRFELVEMYIKQPPLVPPFSIFYYIWKILYKVKTMLYKPTTIQPEEFSFNNPSDCCEYVEPLVLKSGKSDPVKEKISVMDELYVESKHYHQWRQVIGELSQKITKQQTPNPQKGSNNQDVETP